MLQLYTANSLYVFNQFKWWSGSFRLHQVFPILTVQICFVFFPKLNRPRLQKGRKIPACCSLLLRKCKLLTCTPFTGYRWRNIHPKTIVIFFFSLQEITRQKLPFLWTCSNSVLASGDFCRLLITFANSFDPDQDRQNVGPDLDPNCLTLWWYSRKNFDNVNFEKNQQTTKRACKITYHVKS